MGEKKLVLGLDLGIASVGWSLLEKDGDKIVRIVDLGSFVFSEIEDGKSGKTENVIRRTKRSMRRQRRRRLRRREDGRELFKKTLGFDVITDVIEKNAVVDNPFVIKARGLEEMLTREELAVALYHYLKFRGYRSNRKTEEKDIKGDDGKLLAALSLTQDEMEKLEKKTGKEVFITPFLLHKLEERTKNAEDKSLQPIHNSDGRFIMTARRAWYEKEINALLDKQISYGVVDGKFKEEYLAIWSRQRDYSDGPDKSSPYYRTLDEVVGTCVYDGKKRAPRDSYSAQSFIILSSLVNLVYYDGEGSDGKRLTSEQIKKGLELCLGRKETKYSALFKALGINPVSVKGLRLGRKQFGTCIGKFKEKHGIDPQTEIDPRMHEDFLVFEKDYLYKNSSFVKGSEFLQDLMKALEGAGVKKGDPEIGKLCDRIAQIMLVNKTDERIAEECEKQGISKKIAGILTDLKDCKGVIDLSFDVIEKIIPSLKEGLTYDKAMAKAGYVKKGVHRQGKIPELGEAFKELGISLTNPAVKHTLVQMRTVVNAVIDKYGTLDEVAVEMARELKKKFEERGQIRSQQLDNLARNDHYRNEILEKFPDRFKSYRSISKDALLRYKLYKNQLGVSPYTNRMIPERAIFSENYQIDHIMPYSRSFDDSFDNKVLVEASANQEKRERLPYEWLGEEGMKTVHAYLSGHLVSRKKRENLLAKKIPEDFINRNATDTSYIARLAKDILNAYAVPEGKQVRCVSGGVTAKLRDIWRLGGHTHTYLSKSPTDYRSSYESDFVYKSFDHTDGLKFTFNNKGKDIVFEYKKKKAKEKKPLSEAEERYNRCLDDFAGEAEYFRARFMSSNDKTLVGLQESLNPVVINDGPRSSESINAADSRRKEAGYFVFSLLHQNIVDYINQKDRSNHLHHAVDATVIACASPWLINRISRLAALGKGENFRVVDENGEIETFLPYDDFRKELFTRVYQRDKDKILEELSRLSYYKDHPLERRDIHVVVPARRPNKQIEGAISKETILGVGIDGVSLTKTISVDKLDSKKVEDISDKHGGNKAVYEACKAWVEGGKKPPYPMLNKDGGRPIKKVKVVEFDSFEGKVELGESKFAENADVVRVNVYKKKDGGDTIYMVPIYYYTIARERIIERQKAKDSSKLSKEPLYTLMWAYGSNGICFISKEDLDLYYDCILSLPRYSLIEVTLKDGKHFLCYSAGVTSGLFEVYSCLGDKADLETAMKRNLDDRIRITISTIKSIKLRSISALGWVN